MMTWRTTLGLLLLAGLVFVFIYFVERKSATTSVAASPPPRLLALRPEEISAVKFERTNQIARADKTNQSWNLTFPTFYPANTLAIDGLVEAVCGLTTPTYISPQELAASHHSIADYGLDFPTAALTLFRGETRTELLLGSRTPAGDHVYAQLLTMP